MPEPAEEAAEVLHFWFEETRPRQWFAKDPGFDGLVPERFLGLTGRAMAGDVQALVLSRRAVASGWVAAEPEPAWRQFWLMPQMQSEELAVQEAACRCSNSSPTPAQRTSTGGTGM